MVRDNRAAQGLNRKSTVVRHPLGEQFARLRVADWCVRLMARDGNVRDVTRTIVSARGLTVLSHERKLLR